MGPNHTSYTAHTRGRLACSVTLFNLSSVLPPVINGSSVHHCGTLSVLEILAARGADDCFSRCSFAVDSCTARESWWAIQCYFKIMHGTQHTLITPVSTARMILSSASFVTPGVVCSGFAGIQGGGS